MTGLIEKMLRDLIESKKDGKVKSSPELSVLWGTPMKNACDEVYGMFLGSDLICFGHGNSDKPYEIHIPARDKVRANGPLLIDILRASGMDAELFGETIVLEGMEVPWNIEKMFLNDVKITVN